MTGILVTRFKMGLLGIEDLEEMAADEIGAERRAARGRQCPSVLGLLNTPVAGFCKGFHS